MDAVCSTGGSAAPAAPIGLYTCSLRSMQRQPQTPSSWERAHQAILAAEHAAGGVLEGAYLLQLQLRAVVGVLQGEPGTRGQRGQQLLDRHECCPRTSSCRHPQHRKADLCQERMPAFQRAPLGVLDLLLLQLALGQPGAHVVRVDQGPVQGHSALRRRSPRRGCRLLAHLRRLAPWKQVSAACWRDRQPGRRGAAHHLLRQERTVCAGGWRALSGAGTFQWRFRVQNSQICMPHVQHCLVAGRRQTSHVTTSCVRGSQTRPAPASSSSRMSSPPSACARQALGGSQVASAVRPCLLSRAMQLPSSAHARAGQHG